VSTYSSLYKEESKVNVTVCVPGSIALKALPLGAYNVDATGQLSSEYKGAYRNFSPPNEEETQKQQVARTHQEQLQLIQELPHLENECFQKQEASKDGGAAVNHTKIASAGRKRRCGDK
jgi:hypothetical protein